MNATRVMYPRQSRGYMTAEAFAIRNSPPFGESMGAEQNKFCISQEIFITGNWQFRLPSSVGTTDEQVVHVGHASTRGGGHGQRYTRLSSPISEKSRSVYPDTLYPFIFTSLAQAVYEMLLLIREHNGIKPLLKVGADLQQKWCGNET